MTILPQPKELRPVAMNALDIELATVLPNAPLMMPTQELERAQSRPPFWGRHTLIPISLRATTR